jgi:membrane fusion protein, copper/silver efflux system
MKKAVRPVLLFLILAGGFVAGSLYTRRTAATSIPASGKKILYYIDPMHPAYKSSKPGIAPDCGMQLEPVYEDAGTASSGVDGGTLSTGSPGPQPAGSVKIGAEKQQLFGVRIGQAEKASGAYTLRLFGRAVPDESRIYRLNSGVDGIIRETSAVTTGSQVSKNQLLAEFSSPDVLSPMQAYLFTVNTLDQVKQGGGANESQLEVNTSNVYQTYDRLQSLGMSSLQIEEIARTRKIARTIKILAPAAGFVLARNVSPGQRFEKGAEWYRIADLNRIWIVADVPGSQAQYIRPGLRARVTLLDQKKTLVATVAQVLPQFDAATRTLKVRLEADNPGFLLRPDMFVDVELPIALPPTIAVPADAVLDSGLRKTVFVDLGGGYFEPRQVETGWRFGDRVEIAKGLEPGERIVISGNFLLDSESRMKQAAGTPVQSAPVQSASALSTSSQSAKDPVCGMDLGAAKTGYESEHGGKRYSFCSSKCQRAFAKEAERYLNAGAGSHISARGPS